MICLVIVGASAALPIPTIPLSVSTSQISHSWNRKDPMLSPRSKSASDALVQKLACGATVLPFQRNTRVRILLIFIAIILSDGVPANRAFEQSGDVHTRHMSWAVSGSNQNL
jgi:hypothetical protein